MCDIKADSIHLSINKLCPFYGQAVVLEVVEERGTASGLRERRQRDDHVEQNVHLLYQRLDHRNQKRIAVRVVYKYKQTVQQALNVEMAPKCASVAGRPHQQALPSLVVTRKRVIEHYLSPQTECNH